MAEAIIRGILHTFGPTVLMATSVGIIPGIGVLSIMAVIIPISYKWDPTVIRIDEET